ncbi:uncharacterized protein TM35_000073410 [Trypanosoma theileri]|uniref:Uncharacterized protein n=1 Tax=Trypanosoma theileri TaxID=67003 RepID=A0A1X0P1W1_9TRYP|nr:uncharacterized protein TM35_000073410 [Trypanosoma theileri]ORC90917.1 hypothetical protein TM35_000073410 [Trypanosoma theileri]
MNSCKTSEKSCTSNSNLPHTYAEIQEGEEEEQQQQQQQQQLIRDKAWEETVGVILQWVSGALEGDGESLDLIDYLLQELDHDNLITPSSSLSSSSHHHHNSSCCSSDSQTGIEGESVERKDECEDGNESTAHSTFVNDDDDDDHHHQHHYIMKTMMESHEISQSSHISEDSQERKGSIEQSKVVQYVDPYILQQEEEEKEEEGGGVYTEFNEDCYLDNMMDVFGINMNNYNYSSYNGDFMRSDHGTFFDTAILIKLAEEMNSLEVDSNSESRIQVLEESEEDKEDEQGIK